MISASQTFAMYYLAMTFSEWYLWCRIHSCLEFTMHWADFRHSKEILLVRLHQTGNWFWWKEISPSSRNDDFLEKGIVNRPWFLSDKYPQVRQSRQWILYDFAFTVRFGQFLSASYVVINLWSFLGAAVLQCGDEYALTSYFGIKV